MFGSIKLKPLLISLAIPLLGGFLSNWLSGDVEQVYLSLTLPSFAPDPKLFGIVWPILYVMIGFACYLIWTSKPQDQNLRTQALTFYGIQLFLNFLWSPFFFRFQLFRFAFWLLAAILILTIITTAYFAMIKKSTLVLMLPYTVWLVFALILNRAVASLN